VALLLGSLLGAIAGLGGKRVDRFVLFGIEIVQSIPALVIVAAAAAFLPASFFLAAVLIGLTAWTDSARLVRAEARRLRSAAFVEAARAAGAPRWRLLVRHVLPHALPPALSTAPYVLGGAVLTEAGLSFLGLGTPPPAASWGRALADARDLLISAPWCVLPPAAALVLLVLAARKLGDAALERSRMRSA
jgi:peptide/nickel transport system permease protein